VTRRPPCVGLLLALVVLIGGLQAGEVPEPKVLVEMTDYAATSRLEDVQRFCTALAQRSPRVRLSTLGQSHEGRDLPLLILADPPLSTPSEAAQSGKLVVFLFANIHAGEVSGKEALQLLARDLRAPEAAPLFQRLIILINPVLNADGNERIATTNRPWQGGPIQGVGIRANAQGLDLNRDFVKLASPEIRALVKLLNDWDPRVIVDCHDTDGSFHRYPITYDGPRHPAADPRLITFGRDRFLPEVSRRLDVKDRVKTFVYGDFNRDYTRWETYPALPRYSTQYFALRGRLGLLSEAYTYAPFPDRVRATRAFLSRVCAVAADLEAEVRRLTAAEPPVVGSPLPLRHQTQPLPGRVDVLGWVEIEQDGRRQPTNQPKEYPVTVVADCVPTLSVTLPKAYLVPAHLKRVLANLRLHGVQTETLASPRTLEVEVVQVVKLTRAGNPFQGVRLSQVDTVTVAKQQRSLPAGTVVVPTAQPLGRLAAFLLEAQADDGLAAWGFLDNELAEDKPYPILRQVK
jgi:dipeptidyl-peptidase-4